MSTTTAVPDASTTLDVSGTAPVPFGRLAKVELRKMLDTKGGAWLLGLTLLFLVITVSIVLLVVGLTDDTGAPALMDWAQILVIPLSILLPVFPILSVTSEWSQRTGLITFGLESNRTRVLMAKLVAVVTLAVVTVLVASVLAVLANPVAASLDGSDATWEVDGRVLGATMALQLLYFLMAFGLGTAILSSPGAISAFYVASMLVPLMVYSTLYFAFEWAQDVIPWIDLQFATADFLLPGEPIDGKNIAQAVVATLIWVVIPITFGLNRIRRAEIK